MLIFSDIHKKIFYMNYKYGVHNIVDRAYTFKLE